MVLFDPRPRGKGEEVDHSWRSASNEKKEGGEGGALFRFICERGVHLPCRSWGRTEKISEKKKERKPHFGL